MTFILGMHFGQRSQSTTVRILRVNRYEVHQPRSSHSLNYSQGCCVNEMEDRRIMLDALRSLENGEDKHGHRIQANRGKKRENSSVINLTNI